MDTHRCQRQRILNREDTVKAWTCFAGLHYSIEGWNMLLEHIEILVAVVKVHFFLGGLDVIDKKRSFRIKADVY